VLAGKAKLWKPHRRVALRRLNIPPRKASILEWKSVTPFDENQIIVRKQTCLKCAVIKRSGFYITYLLKKIEAEGCETPAGKAE